MEWKGYNKEGNIDFEIKEGNGKVKIYYLDGILLFEGEYLNGKINGQGKEYDYDGKLEFEGEYINEERNGKGKEYYDDGKLKFDGEYLNGKRNGKGKEYYIDGELYFEGEYLNGKRWNGKGYNKEGNIDFEIKEGFGKGKGYILFNGFLIFSRYLSSLPNPRLYFNVAIFVK